MSIEQPAFNKQNGEENEDRRSNVIEGPWVKRDPKTGDGNPEKKPEVVPLPEPQEGREAKIEKIREELIRISGGNKNGQKESEEEPELKSKKENNDEDEKARIPFSGGYQEFEPCKVCGGKGRRYFIFTCPACGGLGRVVSKSSHESGYYEVDRSGSVTKN